MSGVTEFMTLADKGGYIMQIKDRTLIDPAFKLPKSLENNSLRIVNPKDREKYYSMEQNKFRVTEKDLLEFNQWIKRGDITPRLRSMFKTDNDYEDYMVRYQQEHPILAADPAVLKVDDKGRTFSISHFNDEEDPYYLVYKSNDGQGWHITSSESEELKSREGSKEFRNREEAIQYRDKMNKKNRTFSTSNNYYAVYLCDGELEKTYVTAENESSAKDAVNKLHPDCKISKLQLFDDYNKAAEKYIKKLEGKRTFSEAKGEREKVSKEMLEKAKTEGVVQKKPNGAWGIISIQAGEWWIPDYESKENAEAALSAYHANKSRHFSISHANDEEDPYYLVYPSHAGDGWHMTTSESDALKSRKGAKEFRDKNEATAFLDRMNRKFSVNVNDPEDLGISSYILCRFVSTNKDADYFYYDMISELHPWFDLVENKKGRKILSPDKKWNIEVLTNGDTLPSIYKQYIKLTDNRSFSEQSIPSKAKKLVVYTSNPEQVKNILETINKHGEVGHTFDIAIDYKDENQEELQWDGDGSDRIYKIEIEEQKELDKSFGAPLKDRKWDRFLGDDLTKTKDLRKTQLRCKKFLADYRDDISKKSYDFLKKLATYKQDRHDDRSSWSAYYLDKYGEYDFSFNIETDNIPKGILRKLSPEVVSKVFGFKLRGSGRDAYAGNYRAYGNQFGVSFQIIIDFHSEDKDEFFKVLNYVADTLNEISDDILSHTSDDRDKESVLRKRDRGFSDKNFSISNWKSQIAEYNGIINKIKSRNSWSNERKQARINVIKCKIELAELELKYEEFGKDYLEQKDKLNKKLEELTDAWEDVLEKEADSQEKSFSESCDTFSDKKITQCPKTGKWYIEGVDTPFETEEDAKLQLATMVMNDSDEMFSKTFSYAQFNPMPAPESELGGAGIDGVVGTVILSVAYAHMFHLSTEDYAAHIALDEYYNEMPGIVDELAEAWAGMNDNITWRNYIAPKGTALEYLQDVRFLVKFVNDNATEKESELGSMMDNILSQLDSTIYKLKRLSMGRKVFSK